MHKFLKIQSAITLLMLTACGSTSDTTDACGDLGLNTRIVYGTRCQDTNRSAIARLELRDEDDNEFGLCSGTLISPTRVLTAAHCVLNDVRKVIVHIGGESIPASALVAHPGNDVDSDSINSSREDVAVIYLSRASSVSPLPILASRQFTAGERFSVFGYGLDQDGESEKLRSGEMQADDVSNGIIESEHREESSGVCFGDSGGPAIASVALNDGFAPAIVGVASALLPPDDLGVGLLPPLPGIPGPFPLPLPFFGDEINCELGAKNFHASVQIQSVLDFIAAHAPDASYR